MILRRRDSGVAEVDSRVEPCMGRGRARGVLGGGCVTPAPRAQKLCGMGRANPALAAKGCSDYGCFLVTCPSSRHFSVGFLVPVRFAAVSGAVGVCFGPGRAPLSGATVVALHTKA